VGGAKIERRKINEWGHISGAISMILLFQNTAKEDLYGFFYRGKGRWE